MKVSPIFPAFGVEIQGLNLAEPIPSESAMELRRLFRNHHLLVVRGQQLSIDDQLRFVQSFARVQKFRNGLFHAYISNILGDPTGRDRLPFHSDGAFLNNPVWGLSLYGEEVASVSSPTTFVSSVRACAALPEPLRDRIAGLSVMHILDREPPQGRNRRVRIDQLDSSAPENRYHRAIHPIVRPFGDGDGPALFVNEFHTSHVVGMDLEESEALLQDLFVLAYSPEHVYEHRWFRDDLLVWNNIALQHGRPRTVDDTPRTLRRMVLTDSL